MHGWQNDSGCRIDQIAQVSRIGQLLHTFRQQISYLTLTFVGKPDSNQAQLCLCCGKRGREGRSGINHGRNIVRKGEFENQI